MSPFVAIARPAPSPCSRFTGPRMCQATWTPRSSGVFFGGCREVGIAVAIHCGCRQKLTLASNTFQVAAVGGRSAVVISSISMFFFDECSEQLAHQGGPHCCDLLAFKPEGESKRDGRVGLEARGGVYRKLMIFFRVTRPLLRCHARPRWKQDEPDDATSGDPPATRVQFGFVPEPFFM